MTELTFLIDLLLNHKLPKATKDAVAARVIDVEKLLATIPPTYPNRPMPNVNSNQAPSMQAIMARNPDLAIASEPVAVIAQTPQAVAAMNSRAAAIGESMAGKIDKVTGRPRKF